MSALYLELDDGGFYSVTRIVVPVSAHALTHGWRLVQLQGKRTGVVYVVRDGGACDCPDSQFRQREGGCKHSRAMQEAGLVTGAGMPVLVREEKATIS